MAGKRAYRFPDARLLLFARAPVPGRVKTRLVPLLGEQGAADLYTGMLNDIVGRLSAARVCPLEIWYDGDAEHPLLQRLAAGSGAALYPQRGADLGERMALALEAALARASAAVLVGSDCPALAADDVVEACAVLEAGDDAVLSPVEDGGYCLIGLRRVDRHLFAGLPWSTPQVMCETRTRLAELAWRWRELRVLWDVDRPEDVPRWQRLARNRNLPGRPPGC